MPISVTCRKKTFAIKLMTSIHICLIPHVDGFPSVSDGGGEGSVCPVDAGWQGRHRHPLRLPPTAVPHRRRLRAPLQHVRGDTLLRYVSCRINCHHSNCQLLHGCLCGAPSLLLMFMAPFAIRRFYLGASVSRLLHFRRVEFHDRSGFSRYSKSCRNNLVVLTV